MTDALVVIDADPALRRYRGQVETFIVNEACRGQLKRGEARTRFMTLARRVGPRHGAPTFELAQRLADDLTSKITQCVDTPFCDLPKAAERVLRSSQCRIRR